VPSTWSPVVITVPIAAPGTATSLTINLTNNLSFTPYWGHGGEYDSHLHRHRRAGGRRPRRFGTAHSNAEP
jgi:hypothetical protein